MRTRSGLALFAAALAAVMLAYAPVVMTSAREALARFALQALPALLPFMIAAKLMLASGAGDALGLPLRPIMRWLGLPNGAAGVWMASIIAGYPVGARLTADFAEANGLDARQAQTLAIAASHPGPMFVMGIVGARYGIGMGVCVLLGCAAGGIIAAKCVARRSVRAAAVAETSGSPTVRQPGFARLLTHIIHESCMSMLPIGGAMVFFGVVVGLLEHADVLEIAGNAAPLLAGLLEMVAGCDMALAGEARIGVIMVTIVLGWGGLSVAAQSLVFLSQRGVSAGQFLLGKAIQAMVAGVMAAACGGLIEPTVSAAWAENNVSNAASLWWFPPAWAAFCAVLCLAASKATLRGRQRCSRERSS